MWMMQRVQPVMSAAQQNFLYRRQFAQQQQQRQQQLQLQQRLQQQQQQYRNSVVHNDRLAQSASRYYSPLTPSTGMTTKGYIRSFIQQQQQRQQQQQQRPLY